MNAVEYRDVVGFPGYRVGSDGSIWCCLRTGPKRRLCLSEKWRRKNPKPRPDGYVWVNLVRAGRGYGRALHRLILEAFVGPPAPGHCGCHENGDRYSMLVFDNRGVGNSDKPLMRYTTSEMAMDVMVYINILSIFGL